MQLRGKCKKCGHMENLSSETNMQESIRAEGIKVSSLAKAMKVLECFSAKEMELGVTEISNKLGMNKSSVSNIISTFCQLGYIQKCAGGKYSLGLRFLEYSFIINQHLGYSGAVYDIILDVSNCTGMIVYLGIPWGENVLYLNVVHPSSLLSQRPYTNILGETAPMYCTGIGKAMLSAMPESEWAERIPETRKKFTEHTLTELDAIMDELRACRTRGYSLDNMEKDYGIRCVGVPVYDKKGRLAAAISLSGPESNFSGESITRYAGILKEAALKMQERLYR